MAKRGTPPKPVTTMVIKDVQIADGGELAGDLVISVEAKRKGATYLMPFQIAAVKITEIDLEALKLKVVEEVDRRESEANQHEVILDRLRRQIGKTIPLD